MLKKYKIWPPKSVHIQLHHKDCTPMYLYLYTFDTS